MRIQGGVSREGAEGKVAVACMGESVKLGRIVERLGREEVGEDGEEEGTGTRCMGVVGTLRVTIADSVNLPWAFAGHSFSFSSSNVIC